MDTIYKHDPVLRLLHKKLGLTPSLAYIGHAAIQLGCLSLYCWKMGCLFVHGHIIGLWEDYGFIINNLLAFSAFWALYIWVPQSIGQVLRSLKQNKVIRGISNQRSGHSPAISDYSSSVTAALNRLSSWWLIVSSIVLSVLISVFLFAHDMRMTHIWYVYKTAPFVFIITAYAVDMTVLLLSVGRIAVFASELRKLFRLFDLDIRPLHPDRGGGLGSIGQFSVRLGGFIAVLGLNGGALLLLQQYSRTGSFVLVGRYFSFTLGTWLGIIAYLALIPVSFLAFVWTAHSAMKRAKDERLLRIAEQFELVYGALQSHISQPESSYCQVDLEGYLDQIEQLQKLYKVTEAFPVWPFNFQDLVRFVTTTISPLALTLLPTLLELLI